MSKSYALGLFLSLVLAAPCSVGAKGPTPAGGKKAGAKKKVSAKKPPAPGQAKVKAGTKRKPVLIKGTPIPTRDDPAAIRVALFPISATGRRAKRVARRLTRHTIRQLRRTYRKKKGRAVLVNRRKAAASKACIHQAPCLRALCAELGVDYIVTGHVITLNKAYHLDLAIAAATVGRVVDTKGLDHDRRAMVTQGSQAVFALLKNAPTAIRQLKAAAAAERRRKAEEKALAAKLEKHDEDPVDPSAVLATGKSPRQASRRGFFSTIFSMRYWPGWTALALATASLGSGIAFGVVAQGAVSDAEAATTQVNAWILRDKAQINAGAANLLFGIAGGLAVASVAMHIVQYTWLDSERKERGPSTMPARATLRVQPTIGGLSLSGTF